MTSCKDCSGWGVYPSCQLCGQRVTVTPADGVDFAFEQAIVAARRQAGMRAARRRQIVNAKGKQS